MSLSTLVLCSVPAGRPKNLRGVVTSPRSISLYWDEVAGMDSYVVFYRSVFETDFEAYGASSVPANFTWLEPGTMYYFYVVGYIVDVGNGVSSKIFQCKTFETSKFFSFGCLS